MVVSTILLDFSFAPGTLDTDDRQEEALTQSLKQYVPQLVNVFRQPMDDGGGSVLLYTGSRGTFVTARVFTQGHLTVNIEYYRKEDEEELFNRQQVGKLERDIANLFASQRHHIFPALKRCGISRYFPSSDERLLEYDVDEVVFEEKSSYQKVEIVHSKTLGNLLILDGLQNLSDKDLIYTETLMMRGQYPYEGKEIVILGGGDGALLYELLKEKPKKVLMFELDDVVIKACKMHMRKCCGNVLDNLSGDNYEIIIGDCMESLNAMVAEGKQFDYVFGDLTDVPVTPSPENEIWDFIRLILNTSLKILKPSGKYLTHCCGVACPEAAKMFEEHLSTLDVPVGFSTSSAFIPSFMEDWLFYQIWKKGAN